MIFSKPITDIIKERTSWRTYSKLPLEKESNDKLREILKLENFRSPFAECSGKCRFELIGMPEFDPDEKKKLGTYGLIAGAQEFVVGAVQESECDRENFGYSMEVIILAATDMGLGTCWLGGFFNRSLFSAKIRRASNEIVPAITPIGYTAEKRRLKEKVVRSIVRAKYRYPWENLFFEDDFSKPLDREKLGNYAILLENLRLGPSAGNKQPWRVLKEPNNNIYHFFIKHSEDKKGLAYSEFRRLDIGIATSHFDLTAKELGIVGKWAFEKPEVQNNEDLKYIISWKGT